MKIVSRSVQSAVSLSMFFRVITRCLKINDSDESRLEKKSQIASWGKNCFLARVKNSHSTFSLSLLPEACAILQRFESVLGEFSAIFSKNSFFSICLLCLMRLTNLVWTQSIGFPTYCRVVTAIENVTSKMTVAFVCKRKIAESIFTWFIYNSSSNSSSAIVSKLCRYELEIFYASEEGRENICIRFPSNYW